MSFHLFALCALSSSMVFFNVWLQQRVVEAVTYGLQPNSVIQKAQVGKLRQHVHWLHDLSTSCKALSQKSSSFSGYQATTYPDITR